MLVDTKNHTICHAWNTVDFVILGTGETCLEWAISKCLVLKSSFVNANVIRCYKHFRINIGTTIFQI